MEVLAKLRRADISSRLGCGLAEEERKKKN